MSSTPTPASSRLWAAGGISTDGTTVNTLEESDYVATGNGAWTENGKSVIDAAGQMGLIVNDKLFILGGSQNVNDTSFSAVTANGRDADFDNTGGITGSINSTANSLLTPRAMGVAVFWLPYSMMPV